MSSPELSDWLKSFGVAIIVNATAILALSLAGVASPAPPQRTEIIIESPGMSEAASVEEALAADAAIPSTATAEQVETMAPAPQPVAPVEQAAIAQDDQNRPAENPSTNIASVEAPPSRLAATEAASDTAAVAENAGEMASASLGKMDQSSPVSDAEMDVAAQPDAAGPASPIPAPSERAGGSDAGAERASPATISAPSATQIAPSETDAAAVSALAPEVDTAGRVGAVSANVASDMPVVAPQATAPVGSAPRVAPTADSATQAAVRTAEPAQAAQVSQPALPAESAAVTSASTERVAATTVDASTAEGDTGPAVAQDVLSTEGPAAPGPGPVAEAGGAAAEGAEGEKLAMLPQPQPQPQPQPPAPEPPKPGTRRIAYSVVADVMRRHGGGACSVVLSGRDAAGRFGFAAYGITEKDAAPFRTAFERETGVSPPLRPIFITPQQCLALAFVRSAENYPAFRLSIALDVDSISSGSPISGTIGQSAGRHLLLLVVDDEGLVQPVATFAPGARDAAFSAPMTLTGDAVDTAQLLVAIATDVSLAAAAPKGGDKADAFFLALNDRLAINGIAPDVALAPFTVR